MTNPRDLIGSSQPPHLSYLITRYLGARLTLQKSQPFQESHDALPTRHPKNADC